MAGAAALIRMWEGRAAPGREDEAAGWLRDEAVPAALATAGCVFAEAFVGAGDDDTALLVLITRWSGPLPDGWSESPPDRLLAREHSWPFRPL